MAKSLKCRIEEIEALLSTFDCTEQGAVVAFGTVAADGSLIDGCGVDSSLSGGEYSIAFNPALSGEYSITLGVAEDRQNRDGRIIQWIDGTKSGAGFDVHILTGDNGGAADARVTEDWSFSIIQKKQILCCTEPDAPIAEDEILIRHQMFNGMGPKTVAALREVDVRFVEEFVRLGPEGIDALPVSGIGKDKAAGWHDQACKIMERHRV